MSGSLNLIIVLIFSSKSNDYLQSALSAKVPDFDKRKTKK